MALGWRKEYSRYKGFYLNVLTAYKNKPDVKVFFELILSIIAVTIFSVFALRPTAITILGLYKEIKAKEELVAKMDTKIANIKSAQDLVLKEQTRLTLLDTAIPDSPRPDQFVRQIEGITAKDNSGLTGMSLGEATLLGENRTTSSREDTEKLPAGALGLEFTLTLASDYKSLYSFLSDFEFMRRPIKMGTVNISQSSDEEGNSSLNLGISGQAPYFKAESNKQKQNEKK